MARPTSIEFSVAIHVLTILAEQRTPASLTSNELAGSIQANPSYIRAVLAPLREKGIVHSQGGRGGGWSLAVPAETISLASLWELFHDDEVITRHTPDPQCAAGRRVNARLEELEEKAKRSILQTMQEHSIADLTRS